MSLPNNDAVMAGQNIYNPFFLKLYDVFVVYFSNGFIWKCPKSVLIQNFGDYK